MFVVYYIAVTTMGAIVTDWTNDTLFGEMIMPTVSDWMVSIGAAEWLQGLVVDGIIGGVGAVLGFVPQMVILFFLLSVLENCGYMVRIAFIMDRIFRRFGLSGKSFIPMLIGSGCGIPGIMASKTIETQSDRRMTVMTTTFIPCGAKLPIIALIAGAIYPTTSWWVSPSIYFLGVAAVLVTGIMLKKTRMFVGEAAPFVMELPRYHIPTLRNVLMQMWERSKSFIIKAGTVIFIAVGIIWFLQTFNWNLQMVEQSESILASIGRALAPIFAPIGFGNWQATVATISGLVAKEAVVGTLGVLFGIAEAAEDDPALLASVAGMFTVVSAYSFMVFNMLCAPCFAAIGAMRREMNNWKWTVFAVAYQTIFAYVIAFIVYQLGIVFLLGASFGFATVIAIAALLGLIWMMVRPGYKGEKVSAAGAKARVGA